MYFIFNALQMSLQKLKLLLHKIIGKNIIKVTMYFNYIGSINQLPGDLEKMQHTAKTDKKTFVNFKFRKITY